MRKFRFVITGGPCGGKSDGIKVLKKVFAYKGFKVITIAETATELITSGITPWELSNEQFQSILIDRVINKETTAWLAATCLQQEQVIILFDRGLLDNKAYMPYEMFVKILATHGLTEADVMKTYDAVFHMLTAADGALEAYSNANNEARRETPEEAREKDKNTQAAWACYPNVKLIDNSTGFSKKIDRLLLAIFDSMGIEPFEEKERLFLIEKYLKELSEKRNQ